MKVVVTGAAGYIGGQTLIQLIDAGHDVLAIDIVPPPGHLMIVPCSWHTGDFVSPLSLDAIKLFCPDVIVHCAGTSLVGPSMTDPEDYYNNNFVKTKILLDFLVQHHYKNVRVIFSSSAATYGNPIMTPCLEMDPTEPISPYGQSKLMTEWLLQAYHRAYGLDYVAFRYFNACGADSLNRHGQDTGGTHIIARVLESIKHNETFTLNGDNFETPDGTCVRDYIHVEDLADAHVLALNTRVPSGVYNLGTNQGFSNREIIAMAEKVTGKSVALAVGPARSGDPAMLTADASRFITVANWSPKYDLEHMIGHAWNWYFKS
jgi:UDP-glucose 4-epimerase